MKAKIYSSLIAVLLLSLCVNLTYAQDTKVYNLVSLKTPPTYPGGMAKFYAFIVKNIKYPSEAFKTKTQGIVQVSFTIEKDGSLTDIKTVNKLLGAGTDEEAIRVIKLAKNWNPGLINGVPVRVNYQLPIKFTMKK